MTLDKNKTKAYVPMQQDCTYWLSGKEYITQWL